MHAHQGRWSCAAPVGGTLAADPFPYRAPQAKPKGETAFVENRWKQPPRKPGSDGNRPPRLKENPFSPFENVEKVDNLEFTRVNRWKSLLKEFVKAVQWIEYSGSACVFLWSVFYTSLWPGVLKCKNSFSRSEECNLNPYAFPPKEMGENRSRLFRTCVRTVFRRGFQHREEFLRKFSPFVFHLFPTFSTFLELNVENWENSFWEYVWISVSDFSHLSVIMNYPDGWHALEKTATMVDEFCEKEWNFYLKNGT